MRRNILPWGIVFLLVAMICSWLLVKAVHGEYTEGTLRVSPIPSIEIGDSPSCSPTPLESLPTPLQTSPSKTVMPQITSSISTNNTLSAGSSAHVTLPTNAPDTGRGK